MLILFINLAPRNPKRTGARGTSPEVVSLAGLVANPVRYPAVSTLLKNRRSEPEKRHAFLSGS
jgi:hypothetical protein